MYTSIEMKLENKIIRTTAMIDTGNLLKEPITKEKQIKIYNVNIELIKNSIKIEKTKIDYVQIGKDQVRYRNGSWKIEEKT